MSIDIDHVRSVVTAARSANDELLAIINGLLTFTNQPAELRLAFDHEETQILVGSRGVFSRPLERLARLEPLKLAIAPVVKAVISTSDHDVVILDYWAVPGENRIAIDFTHRPDEAARRRYRDELRALVDAGWMHNFAMRGAPYVLMGSKTGVITLDDWVMVSPAENREQLFEMIASYQ